MKMTLVAALSAILISSGDGWAHGSGDRPARPIDSARAESYPFGRAGDPRAATRTVRIGMSDSMRFSPASLTIRRGETVRFVVRNAGAILHEMVLGTKEELTKHAELMRKFPDMEHDEPHMVHVKPGATGEFVWTFDQAGTFHFGCLVPGHYEAGMIGSITVR